MKDSQFEPWLEEKLNTLPRQIQPQRDLWPGIDLAIENQSQNSGRPHVWAGIAASIAIFGLLGLLTLNSLKTGPVELTQLISDMSEQHEKQKQFLLTSYAQQPALTDNWQEQLKELDSAASVIRTALEEDPGDANLIKLLQQVYQQQFKLIQTVHQSRWL